MRALADAPDLPLLPLPSRRGGELRATERNLLVAAVAAFHLLAGWGLLQVAAVQDAVRQVAPMVVDFITIQPSPTPRPAPPAPRPQPRPRVQPTPPPPPILAAPPAPAPEAPAPFVVPLPAPLPRPVEAAPPAPAPAVLPAPPAPPAPPPATPCVIPASNVAYLVPPPIELPLASRRMGEQGTVTLRVRVGTDGLPKAVTLQRSSGHARLDEQALWAMKRARFKPQTEDGVPIEWLVIAPLQYEIE